MRELEPNIPILGLEDYHITKRGNLYSKKKESILEKRQSQKYLILLEERNTLILNVLEK